MGLVNMYATDVLVIGAGMGGMIAAKTAVENGLKVTIVDKARAATSGPTAFAAGDFLCWLPKEDSLDEWVDYYLEVGEGLNSKEWIINLLKRNYEIISKLDQQGYYIEKDTDGSYLRRGGRGKITKCVLMPTYRLMKDMRKNLIKQGVKILDRIQMTAILTDEKGKACGASGFNVRTGEGVQINAKSTILAAGGCSYRGPFFGQDVVTGDGLVMAYEVGASLAYMEYGNHFNVSLKAFDTYGQSKFMAHGGKYINKLGESFLERSGEGSRASGHIAVRRMVEEVQSGKGPVYLDLRNFTEKELINKIMPNLALLLQNSFIDFYGTPNEAIPALTGTSNASSAGVLIDENASTAVEGLFAAGDNACKGLVTGACVGLSGISLAWANVTGYLAGQGVSNYIKQNDYNLNDVKIEAKNAYKLNKKEGGINPREIIWKLSEVMGNGYVSIIKHGERLEKAVNRCAELKELLDNSTVVQDYHDLMLWHEANNAVKTAQITLNASIFRNETRGGHFREDYPQKDCKLDNQVLTAVNNNGKLEFKYQHI